MAIVLIILLAVVFVLIILNILGYIFNLGWIGVSKKTLWDWLQLLIIPAVLAVAGYVINLTISRSEREVALDNQRETALQAYIDKISELLLHEGLSKSSEDAEARRVATLQTLIVLPRLDGKRKGNVLLFLSEAGLIKKPSPIIMLGAAGLHGADLRGCDLSGISGASLYDSFISYAILDGANLTGVHLSAVYFEGGGLRDAQLVRANLRDSEFLGTNLSGANLTGADLTGASIVAVNLTGAIVTDEQLDKAKLLQDIIMPDGSKHP